jgi:hypothetical protein
MSESDINWEKELEKVEEEYGSFEEFLESLDRDSDTDGKRVDFERIREEFSGDNDGE